ncbi:mechanosensitive ion channel family protein [Pseudidiomarina sp.]|uniref:mechanosensitive ion channel family protein n=1 Tax=Pseudidiomarina sp. TaxID=2081707 RepID=UPI003A97C9EB
MDEFLAEVRQLFSWLNTELFKVGETAITYGSFFRVLIILIVTYIISRVLQNALRRFASYRKSLAQSSVYALTRITHYVVMLVGALIAVSSIGIDLTKFAIFASALGIGVGFGLQNLISNFTAGIMLLFEKTLKVGDFVELESGVTGEVQEINIRSTIITTNDNIDIVVPNSEFVNGRVTNWTMRDTIRRLKVEFGVAYGTDKELVRKAVLEAASRVPHTLDDGSHRPPQVWLTEFGDSSLNFELVVWLQPEAVNRPSAVKAAFMWEIHTSLEEYDIEIPFPQRDLHIRSWAEDARLQTGVLEAKNKKRSTKSDKSKRPENDAAEEL